ncbi:TIGR03086 family metal-binding protein [Micromonospora sp. WMMD975]|uniref:TIGR03086 family metal-binding protein n=1 Tax=Micromonospora sp. WMMD975 TaxID=3016087 RepID=UPI00249B52D1|nr:TIGR03086 family metal-binding protein [Micromonospora sp. WMMD975]WFE33526.1 TIGR03086 family metal-binding protein [Micromonospora sp. WMMD975]
MGPVELFEAAAWRAVGLAENVGDEQLAGPTPCAQWDVRALLDHLRGGPAYLLAATGHDLDADASYRTVVAQCLAALRQPGALERRCMSPLGFEWSVGEAAAGTFMDQLVHSWDLAVATGQNRTLDPALVEACVAMFLPDMPERGRARGLVGPAVTVAADASAQDRLLAGMGRTP